MKVFFVAGTDTEVGKTYATCVISKYLKEKGFKVGTFKPIESGIEGLTIPDFKRLAKASGDKEKPLFTLKKPLAPYIAAKMENTKINISKIFEFFREDISSGNYDYYFIEGAGGLLVPITENHLFIDIIPEFNCEVILVARTNLGTVNHTLLSIEALKKRGISVRGVVLNEILKTEDKMIEDNISMIEKFSSLKVISLIRYGKEEPEFLNGI